MSRFVQSVFSTCHLEARTSQCWVFKVNFSLSRSISLSTATSVTTWDLYNTLVSPEQDETVCHQEPERVDYQEAAVDASRGAERSLSVSSTTSTGNTGQDAPLQPE